MSGDRVATMTGATTVLGLMFSLLCLDNCMETNLTVGGEFSSSDLKEPYRSIIENAEAAKESNKLIRKTSEEMFVEWERHADTMQDIIARGPPELKNLQPIFQAMDNLVVEVRQQLFVMIHENDLMVQKLDEAKAYLAQLKKSHKESQKEEL